MTTRKIKDLPKELVPCSHPQHNPPSMMVYKQGVYEHICPGCKKVINFTVVNPSL